MLATVLGALNQGFLKTLQLFGVTLLGAIPLGLIISFGSMTRFRPLRWLTRTVVWIVRGTPLMLQLIIIYYVPGQIMDSSPWPMGENGRFLASAIAFIFNYACYFSEIFRGGIEGVPRGQREAGQVLGMTRSQIFFRVQLLQVYKRILPPMGNEIITLVKDTCLARIIAIYELTYAGQAYIKSHGLIWPLLLTGVFYLLFSGLLSWLLRREEARLGYFE